MTKVSKLKTLKPVVEKDEFLHIDSHGSEDEDDDQHSKFLDNLTSITGAKKRLRITQRTEAVSKIKEHALAQVNSANDHSVSKKINRNDLIESLGKKNLGPLLKPNLDTKRQEKTLDAPLEKPQALRVKRSGGYAKVTDEISKWDSIVKGNRKAEQIVFPLNQPSVTIEDARNFSSKFKPKTPLEQQVSELLRGSKHVQEPNEELTPDEKAALSAMSLKEALERRKALAKSRALQSYQEKAARRQNKIKSKSYRRAQKKERMKKHLKEFELLKEQDPEGALQKLKELETRRIEERMTLKHKGGGKWAKATAIRGKYDDNAREALAEQLQMGREITRKIQQPDEESEEEEPVAAVQSDNPWLGGQGGQPAAGQPEVGFRKYWSKINESKKLRAQMNQKSEGSSDEESGEDEEDEKDENQVVEEVNPEAEGEEDVDSDEEGEDDSDEEGEDRLIKTKEDSDDEAMRNKFSEELDEGVVRKKNFEDFAPSQPEDEPKKAVAAPKKRKKSKKKNPQSAKVSKPEPSKTPKVKTNQDIDPNAFINATATISLKSSAPVLEEGADEADEAEEAANEKRMTLAEAFADDDVIEQFREDKRRAVDSAAPKAIDLTLPGWGEWAGAGLKVSRRKRRRFIIQPPPAPKRRDENQGNLILNDDKNPSMRRQLVSQLPFPFSSVGAFESMIRNPVTRNFVPESAVRKLTEPKVIARIGTVIEPMNEDVLVATANHKADDDEAEEKGKRKKKTNKRKNHPNGGKKNQIPNDQKFKSGKVQKKSKLPKKK